MDAAWLDVREQTLAPMQRRAWIERPRGHSKTTDIAISVLYALLHTEAQGILAAADKDQAALIVQAMRRVAAVNQLEGLIWAKGHVSSTTGSTVTVMAADASTSWGILPDFVICDEVCHWTNFEFWTSLYSSAGKKETCVLVCLSNAGVGYDWQWQLRENARNSEDWYFNSLDGPQAPWITERMLEEQRKMLPGPVFARLWLNQWQSSDGEYLSLDECRACCDSTLSIQAKGSRPFRYVAVLDYAEKIDLTAGCIAHWDHDRRQVIIDRLDVVKPTPNRPTPVKWVESWIHQTERLFGPHVQFVIDDWQLLALCQEWSARYWIERIPFHGGATNQILAQHLRQQVLTRQIAWYPGCGEIPTDDGTEDTLETELSQLLVRQTPGGMYRFENRSDGRSHDDRSFVVGIASLQLGQQDQTPGFCIITPPAKDGSIRPIPL